MQSCFQMTLYQCQNSSLLYIFEFGWFYTSAWWNKDNMQNIRWLGWSLRWRQSTKCQLSNICNFFDLGFLLDHLIWHHLHFLASEPPRADQAGADRGEDFWCLEFWSDPWVASSVIHSKSFFRTFFWHRAIIAHYQVFDTELPMGHSKTRDTKTPLLYRLLLDPHEVAGKEV